MKKSFCCQAGIAVALLGRVATATDGARHVEATNVISVARQWDEELIGAIRLDIPKPPAHARNLFHLSLAMWDAWAAYDPDALGYLVTEKHVSASPDTDRNEAISYAAYRLLQYRFPVGYSDVDGRPCHPNAALSQAAFDAKFGELGYDSTFTSTEGDSPAALGNRIAATLIAYGANDGANEGVGICYPDDTGYVARNNPLVFAIPAIMPGINEVFDPNRWQPLAFDFAVTQNGIVIGKSVQRFIGAGWTDVRPFGLTTDDRGPSGLYLDPGPPPQLGGLGDDVVKAAMIEDLTYSSQLDPGVQDSIDVSPGAARRNNPIGTDAGQGHPINPFTRRPYPPNLVNRADYVRVAAQYWADGPRSETPPGHWNVFANSVSDRMCVSEMRICGRRVDRLEWDVKMYLALNGALHDAAIWAWGLKNAYDSSRPITLIRYMASLGQSSNPQGPSFNQSGLPLVDDLVELVTASTTAPGERHESLRGYEGQVAVRSWLGSPADVQSGIGGVGWIIGMGWIPYQLKTFVTPAFPGYASGHSTFSRSAAEVLTQLTRSPFFPGGIATFEAPADQFLTFERGPSQTVELQWATYYDAADEAGTSRRFGGIHPYYDDYPGRVAGSAIGKKAWDKAEGFFGCACRR